MDTPFACPGCCTLLPPATPQCPFCRIRLVGTHAVELWRVDQEIVRLRARRGELVMLLRAPAMTTATSGGETRRTLLVLGAACLAVALSAGTALIWPALGVAGQTVVMPGLTSASPGAVRGYWVAASAAVAVVLWLLARRRPGLAAPTVGAVVAVAVALWQAVDVLGLHAAAGRTSCLAVGGAGAAVSLVSSLASAVDGSPSFWCGVAVAAAFARDGAAGGTGTGLAAHDAAAGRAVTRRPVVGRRRRRRRGRGPARRPSQRSPASSRRSPRPPRSLMRIRIFRRRTLPCRPPCSSSPARRRCAVATSCRRGCCCPASSSPCSRRPDSRSPVRCRARCSSSSPQRCSSRPEHGRGWPHCSRSVRSRLRSCSHPWPVQVVLLPRWLTLGVAGAVLLVLGGTWERRLRDVRDATARLRPVVEALR